MDSINSSKQIFTYLAKVVYKKKGIPILLVPDSSFDQILTKKTIKPYKQLITGSELSFRAPDYQSYYQAFFVINIFIIAMSASRPIFSSHLITSTYCLRNAITYYKYPNQDFDSKPSQETGSVMYYALKLNSNKHQLRPE